MSKELLEKAFEKTKEEEVKAMKRQKIARGVGVVMGMTFALALDALVVWAVVNFMLSISASYVMILGGVILSYLVLAKIKSFKL